ncbi:unnamed protein product, partial [Closterium sp. Yama58-4]
LIAPSERQQIVQAHREPSAFPFFPLPHVSPLLPPHPSLSLPPCFNSSPPLNDSRSFKHTGNPLPSPPPSPFPPIPLSPIFPIPRMLQLIASSERQQTVQAHEEPSAFPAGPLCLPPSLSTFPHICPLPRSLCSSYSLHPSDSRSFKHTGNPLPSPPPLSSLPCRFPPFPQKSVLQLIASSERQQTVQAHEEPSAFPAGPLCLPPSLSTFPHICPLPRSLCSSYSLHPSDSRSFKHTGNPLPSPPPLSSLPCRFPPFPQKSVLQLIASSERQQTVQAHEEPSAFPAGPLCLPPSLSTFPHICPLPRSLCSSYSLRPSDSRSFKHTGNRLPSPPHPPQPSQTSQPEQDQSNQTPRVNPRQSPKLLPPQPSHTSPCSQFSRPTHRFPSLPPPPIRSPTSQESVLQLIAPSERQQTVQAHGEPSAFPTTAIPARTGPVNPDTKSLPKAITKVPSATALPRKPMHSVQPPAAKASSPKTAPAPHFGSPILGGGGGAASLSGSPLSFPKSSSKSQQQQQQQQQKQQPLPLFSFPAAPASLPPFTSTATAAPAAPGQSELPLQRKLFGSGQFGQQGPVGGGQSGGSALFGGGGVTAFSKPKGVGHFTSSSSNEPAAAFKDSVGVFRPFPEVKATSTGAPASQSAFAAGQPSASSIFASPFSQKGPDNSTAAAASAAAGQPSPLPSPPPFNFANPTGTTATFGKPSGSSPAPNPFQK